MTLLAVVLLSDPAPAGLHLPGGVPWPSGVVPYVFDEALTDEQEQTYLDGLREYELAANVQFIPRTNQNPYILFKYSPTGPNLYSVGTPRIVEINLLTRSQICHETGHALGLEHEHQRPNRNDFITVNYGNIAPENHVAFDVLPTGIPFGNYDFESVMHYGRNVYAVAPGTDTIQTKPGYEKYQRRLSNAALSPTDRAHLASLYGPPPVPLSSVVTTTADGGIGSLRAAIYYAQDHPGTTVTFSIPTTDPGHAGGYFTIKPTGSLPPLATDGLVIDATTQPGYAGKPVVFLDGSKLLPEAGELPGLLFLESNCTVKGLGVRRFPWSGMVMLYPDATGNRVTGCSVGLDSAGTAAAPNAFQGIQISDGAHGNTIGGTGPNERNFISGNTQYGVYLSGVTTTGNTILGNHIGTNSDGNAAVPNAAGGIIVTGGATGNSIGGASAAARNVISGNADAGIWIIGSGVSQNTVRGNFLGLNAAGTGAVPNTFAGMYLIGGASDNLVADNVISGNVSEGLRISGAGSTGNRIEGNQVGTSAAGNSAVPNGFAGVTVFSGASGNQIGGTGPGQRNVLSGNGTVGLVFGDPGTQGNSASGNHIGMDSTGMTVVANGFAGVYLTGGAGGNHLGAGPGTGNLISGNGTVGVFVADAATSGNFIRNNRIGPDAAGAATTPQQSAGIWLLAGSQGTQVGGTTPGAGNTICRNSGNGITVYDDPTAGFSIVRNSIFGNGWQPVGVYKAPALVQAKPGLAAAVLATGITVSGSLASTPGSQFSIEFFASPDEAGAVGSHFIGGISVTTNGSGAASFSQTLPAVVRAGQWVSATATSQATGETSEYSFPVQVTSADGDNDGLPDVYESVTPGLGVSNPLDAALDNDGDGFTNLQEFTAGTNPNNSNSRLAATGAVSGGAFQMSFTTVAGKFYQLERSTSLSGAWETVAIHLEGTGGPVVVALPVPPSVTRQFYRVAPGD